MWEYVQAVFLFGLVLVLAWLTTRLVALQTRGPGKGRMVRVLEHIPAGRDRSIMLLEVGGRVYLVGATAEQISLLDAIDDPDTIRNILENVPAATESTLASVLPGSFKEMLARARGQAPGGPAAQNQGPAVRQALTPQAPAAAVINEEIDRLSAQLERLRRLQQK